MSRLSTRIDKSIELIYTVGYGLSGHKIRPLFAGMQQKV
ncbi:hypothetical protein B4080_1650 [Bacillus cereus]|nr:hypothetical protein B4080_1650 [Bacillus cereus]